MTRPYIPFHPLAFILILFAALGLVYSTSIPLFEAPDEQWHYAYVQYVATGKDLPVQSVDQATHLARQEGSQPPLYYLIAAASTFWVDSSDFPGIIWQNPHYGYNVPGIVNDNKNLFIHTSVENMPYHGATLAIHIARLVSLLLGALAIFFTYKLTREIFPDLEFLALSAAACVAFVPQFIWVSSAVSNDSTIVATSALSLWMIVRWLKGKHRLRDAVGIGVSTGLAALAKVSGLGLVLLGFAVLILILRKYPRRLVVCAIAFLATFAVIAGWWYLRNWVLYGEFTGTEMMLGIFGARQTPLTSSQFIAQLGEVWETFWIGFGWGNIRAQPVVYSLLGIAVLLSATGLVIGFLRRRRQLRGTLAKALPLVILAAWAAMVLAEFLRWMIVTQAPHGRLLFPALPALMPIFGIGLTQLAPIRFRRFSAPSFAAALFALSAASPFFLIAPAYAYPPELTTSDLSAITHRVDINYGDKIKLLGFDVVPSRVQPGGALELYLYWQSLAPMDRDYSIGIHVLDPNSRVIGARDSYPGHGMLPTTFWRVGEIIRDAYWVPIAPDAQSPAAAQIQIDAYYLIDKAELPSMDPSGQPITPIVGRLKIASPNPIHVVPENPTHYTFGNVIALTGYDLRSEPTMTLTLYWAQVAPVNVDYTVFVHILDADGKILYQRDQQPMGGANPTSLWDKNEQVVDRYPIDLPPRAVEIELGLYRAETGGRLEVFDAAGHSLGDHVILPLPKP